MSINFPTSLDTLSNPIGTDKVNNAVAGLKHSTQHSNGIVTGKQIGRAHV